MAERSEFELSVPVSKLSDDNVLLQFAYAIASGAPGFSLAGGFASNGYGAHSPGGYGLPSALVCEVVMTLMFLFVIMGATDPRVPAASRRFRSDWC